MPGMSIRSLAVTQFHEPTLLLHQSRSRICRPVSHRPRRASRENLHGLCRIRRPDVLIPDLLEQRRGAFPAGDVCAERLFFGRGHG